jgi:hypothetical protein
LADSSTIELFAVPPSEDEAFRAAWAAEAPPGHTLHRALRDDARFRFASLPGGPVEGVLLITPVGSDLERLAGRQGFIGVRVLGELAAVHWSSPLMYARAVRAGLELPGTLYAPA